MLYTLKFSRKSEAGRVKGPERHSYRLNAAARCLFNYQQECAQIISREEGNNSHWDTGESKQTHLSAEELPLQGNNLQ